jgi:hypothetical protein
MLTLSCKLLSRHKKLRVFRHVKQKKSKSKNFSTISRVEFYNCNKISGNSEQSELKGRMFETPDVSHVTKLGIITIT